MNRQSSESKAVPSKQSSRLNTDALKADFSILDQEVHGHRLVYLDSAASSQKPQVVIDALFGVLS